MRALLAVLLGALLSACGSTVAMQGSSSVKGSAQDPFTGGPPPAQRATQPSGSTSPGAAPRMPGSGPAPSIAGPGAEGLTGKSTPILVGVAYVDVSQQNAFLSSFGEGLDSADRRAMTQLLIEDLNRRGGILGRPVKAVFHKSDLNGDRATEEAAACADFVQDHHVDYAFIAELNDDSYLQCLGRAGVTMLDPTYARLTAAGFARTPRLVYQAGIALDRVADVTAQRLAETSFFTATTPARVGIVYYDEARFAAGERALESALARHGVTVTQRQSVHYPNSTQELSRTVSDSSAAELRFSAAGVTHVLAVEDGIPEAAFALAAAQQHYYPRYGWNSGQSVDNLVGLIPDRALQGSQLVGWYPALDITDEKRFPSATRSCLAFMRKHGQTVDTGNQRLIAVSACENVRFLESALNTGRGAGLLDGLRRLSHYAPTATFDVAFPDGRRDGVSAVRDGAYVSACRCFQYTSGPIAV